MPELPEVETIRSDLSAQIVGKKITGLIINSPKTINRSPATFKKDVIGKKIISISRLGKLLIIELSTDTFILIHLKMTGQLIFRQKNKIIPGGHSQSGMDIDNLPNKHTRLIFNFSDHSQLFFNDLRRFGFVKLADQKSKDKEKSKYGLDVFSPEFGLPFFKTLIKNKKTKLKSFLLNQKFISGIGNIYADEICFASRVRPDRPLNSLSPSEVKKIFSTTKKIIKQAVAKRGTTFNNYRDGEGQTGNFSHYLKVYKKNGQSCPRCGSTIKRIKISSRSTHFCPSCQN